MDQFSKVLLAIDNAHTVPQWALDCRPSHKYESEYMIADAV